jgi:hypothetical protein
MSSYGIRTFTGKEADYAFTDYSVSNIIIPDFFQANADNTLNKDDSFVSSGNSSLSQADKVPLNSFVESLDIKRQNQTVTQTQIVKEPAFAGSLVKGSWKGYFDVLKTTDKSFKISHQGIEVDLVIDGRSVWRGKGTREITYQHTFKPGRHEVMFVAYPEADYEPVKFNVSIMDNAISLKEDALANILKGLGDFDSIYCGVNTGKSADETVDIILKDSKKPVVLFLSSYQHAIWDFKNSNTDKLAAVVTSAKNASASIKNLPGNIPVYHFFKLANTTQLVPIYGTNNIDDTFKSAALQILYLTGRLPAGFGGARQADMISVPEIVLSREKYQHIGFADVSPEYNIFIEYPEKIDVVFNPIPTKYLDPNISSESNRAKLIKPEVQRKSWAECLGATEDIPTGAFRAYYFDIFNSGQPKFSGIVENVSVKSSGKPQSNKTNTAILDEYGIIPNNFGAFWIGNIVLDKDKMIEINIDSSNADTRILIDNKVVKDRMILLEKGSHKVEIEHVNNWGSYGFSLSLNEAQALLAYEELKGQLDSTLPGLVHTSYVGVYGSKNGDNSITLDIEDIGQPIFLILASYDAINWILEGPGAKDIKALLISSVKSKSSIKGSGMQDVSIMYFPIMDYTYKLESECKCQGGFFCTIKDFFYTIDYIKTITGRTINSFSGDYDATSFSVPQTVIDKAKLKILKLNAENNLVAQKKCDFSEISQKYMTDEQHRQIKEEASVKFAQKIAELIRDNNYEDYLHFIEPEKQKIYKDVNKNRFLFLHNCYAGYEPSVDYHLIDRKLYNDIVGDKQELTIPLVWKRNNLMDYYSKIHIYRSGGRWFVSVIE